MSRRRGSGAPPVDRSIGDEVGPGRFGAARDLLLALLLVLTALLAAFWPAGAMAQLPVPPLSGRVIDQTGTLSTADASALTARLAAIEAQRGTQIVVLIVPTTQPEDIATYGQRIADVWKVGRRDVGDGLVIVVAKNDRRMNIEVAKTLEGAIPDVLAGRVIADQMKPAFRTGDFAGGLNAAVDRLDRAIAGEGLPAPRADGSQSERGDRGSQRRGRGGFDLGDLAIFLFVGVPVVGGVLSRIFGRKFGALLTGGGVGAIAWFLTASALVAAGAGLVALFLVGVVGLGLGGGRRGGLGGVPIVWGGGGGGFGGGRGGGGGGGFGSGGSGNFGGGGASGSW